MAPPRPVAPLTDDRLALTPISETDAGEMQRLCDVDGWDDMHTPGSSNVFLTVPGCLRLFVWAASLAYSWEAEDFSANDVHTCFAIRLTQGTGDLAGIVGYTRLWTPDWHGRLTTYYWTAPPMRRAQVATDALKLSMPWALKAWDVDEVFIHALNGKSEKVAKRAGFELTDESIGEHPVFRHGAN